MGLTDGTHEKYVLNGWKTQQTLILVGINPASLVPGSTSAEWADAWGLSEVVGIGQEIRLSLCRAHELQSPRLTV
jgi:hypothetical protein